MMRDDLHATMATSMLNDINTACGSTAVLQLWDGTPPATCEDSDAGTMIAELPCSASVFGTLTGFNSTANPITDDTDTVAGTAAYWRLKTGTSGDTVFQWTEGTDFITDDPVFADGDTCSVTFLELTFTITPPDS